MFAERLRAAMELRELNQKQLAIKAKVSQSHISRSLNGEAVPTVDIAARLARALEVSLDWLCDLPERRVGVLTPDEDQLLKMYQAISNPETRRQILDIVAVFVPGEDF